MISEFEGKEDSGINRRMPFAIPVVNELPTLTIKEKGRMCMFGNLYLIWDGANWRQISTSLYNTGDAT